MMCSRKRDVEEANRSHLWTEDAPIFNLQVALMEIMMLYTSDIMYCISVVANIILISRAVLKTIKICNLTHM